jgi:hypothetical protein
MSNQDPDAFLDDNIRQFEAERDADYSVTPEQAARLRKQYPVTGKVSEGYEKFTPEEFFDGA